MRSAGKPRCINQAGLHVKAPWVHPTSYDCYGVVTALYRCRGVSRQGARGFERVCVGFRDTSAWLQRVVRMGSAAVVLNKARPCRNYHGGTSGATSMIVGMVLVRVSTPQCPHRRPFRLRSHSVAQQIS